MNEYECLHSFESFDKKYFKRGDTISESEYWSLMWHERDMFYPIPEDLSGMMEAIVNDDNNG